MLVREVQLADHALLEEGALGLGLGDERVRQPARAAQRVAGHAQVLHRGGDAVGDGRGDADGGQGEREARQRAEGAGGAQEQVGRAHAGEGAQPEREGARRGRAEEGEQVVGEGEQRLLEVVHWDVGLVVGHREEVDRAPLRDQP